MIDCSSIIFFNYPYCKRLVTWTEWEKFSFLESMHKANSRHHWAFCEQRPRARKSPWLSSTALRLAEAVSIPPDPCSTVSGLGQNISLPTVVLHCASNFLFSLSWKFSLCFNFAPEPLMLEKRNQSPGVQLGSIWLSPQLTHFLLNLCCLLM